MSRTIQKIFIAFVTNIYMENRNKIGLLLYICTTIR